MAVSDVSTSFPDWSTALAPLAGWPEGEVRSGRRGVVQRLYERLRAWRAQRETVRLLHSLDRGTLRDLGITPREIESLVYGDNGDRTHGYDRDWWRK